MSQNKLFVQTFGCQMNERDSEAVTGLLIGEGYILTKDIEEASVVLYNTCSVRDHAEQKIFGRLGYFYKMKQNNPEMVIGIVGCMAQEHGADFFKMNPEIDLVCGPGNLSQIPQLVREIRTKKSPTLAIDKLGDEYGLENIQYREGSVKALVTIMTGCDHKCTYCIVPYTRGAERSRSSQSILREMKDLESKGFLDVMLLGQNVNSYGKALEGESLDFADLLYKIQEHAPRVSRLRFMTSHPKDAHTKMYQAMRDLPMVCEHLHLPVQSGSTRVLRRMKREHTREWFLEQIEEYRRMLPHGSLTTDLIVGFPGETRQDFEETLSLVEQAGFDASFMFKYSPRPHTPALKLEDDVSEQEKNIRLQELIAVQKSVALRKNQALLGSIQEVLFERSSSRNPNRYFGRTRSFKRVFMDSPENLIGTLRNIRVSVATEETLSGTFV